MTPEPIAAVPPEPERMGEFSRIAGVFLEPSKAFDDIVRHPKWLVPMLLVILSGIVFYSVFGQHVTWQRFLQHQLDTNPKAAERMAQLAPDQRARAMEMQVKFAGIAADGAIVVITPLAMLLSAAIILIVANAMGAGLKYKTIFSIGAYSSLTVIVKYALGIVVMFLKNPEDFNPNNPVAFNFGAFMDPLTSSKFLYTIATAVDLFAVWTLLLTATGLKTAAGKRLSFGGAFIAAAVPFGLLVLFGATMAGLFS